MESYSPNSKAVVIGGSNGIGLAIVKELLNCNYNVIIVDKDEPDASATKFNNRIEFRHCNLLDYDEQLFDDLSHDNSICCLMITAGFGRVADFEYLHASEIENLFQVNTIAGIKIIRKFYDRIKSTEHFYSGMMGSIAGLVSSPMFSVYAASKAALCRFIESINIELEVFGTTNRILNVSPGSIKGTRFNGASENNGEMTMKLAQEIVTRLLNSETLYIPEYDAIYRGVIERYNSDPHEFGLSSYQYKVNSGRVFNEKKVKIGYLSGTFDLFHVGHLKLLQRAKQHCDYLIVGVHPDASHKGKETFIPFEERMQIVSGIKYVDKVVESCREDSDAWEKWHYDRLFVGSDYKGTERFIKYEKFFEDKGVEIIYFPYTQGTSSTQIRSTIMEKSTDHSTNEDMEKDNK